MKFVLYKHKFVMAEAFERRMIHQSVFADRLVVQSVPSDPPSSSLHVQVLSQPPSFVLLHIAVGLSQVPTGSMSNLITVVCLTAAWTWNGPDKTLNRNFISSETSWNNSCGFTCRGYSCIHAQAPALD